VVTKTIRQITNLLDRLISKSQTGALPGVGVRIASLRRKRSRRLLRKHS